MSNYTTADLRLLNFGKIHNFLYELDLSDTAMILYSILIDRWEISVLNRWEDENGEIYFYFRNADILAKRKSWNIHKLNNAKKELVEAGLLKIKYSKTGKDNKYYFARVDDEFLAEYDPLKKSATPLEENDNPPLKKSATPPEENDNPIIITKQISKKNEQKDTSTIFSAHDEKNETCENENQAVTNKNVQAEITATTSRKKIDEATKDSLPDFIDPELWEKYIAYKSERREKLSRIGLQMKFAQWRKWHDEGIDVNECIRTAIANDWQGVFKPKKQKKEVEKDLDEMSDNEFYELYGRFGFKNPKDYEKEATTYGQSEKNNFKGLL